MLILSIVSARREAKLRSRFSYITYALCALVRGIVANLTKRESGLCLALRMQCTKACVAMLLAA